jgi:hypothetical protein
MEIVDAEQFHIHDRVALPAFVAPTHPLLGFASLFDALGASRERICFEGMSWFVCMGEIGADRHAGERQHQPV